MHSRGNSRDAVAGGDLCGCTGRSRRVPHSTQGAIGRGSGGLSLETLGFIGLGSIGAPMAGRFVDAGHKIVGFDSAGTQERLPSGAIAASSVEEVVAQVDTLFMSLPNGEASKAVCSEIVRSDERRAQNVVDLSPIGLAAGRGGAHPLEPTEIVY